ncbi:MAG: ATP-binding protein [Spirillospora sp.]
MSGEHHTIELPNTLTTPPEPAPPPVSNQPVLLGELTLPAELESVPRARRFSRSVTTGSDIGHVGDDAEVLVSELVTNAVRHAALTGSALSLRLLRAGSRLRIEVHDQGAGVPHTRLAGGGVVDLMDETGRGWFLVAIIAERHGTDLTPSGKAVWCEVRAWPLDGRPGR